MSTSQSSGTPGQFTGRHMLLATSAFFAVIVTVNVGMAVVASRSWTGLVVPNSYVASQEFEEKRLSHSAQVAAGWVASLSVTAGRARLVIVDGAGNPVDLGPVTLRVNRPVGGHEDQQVAFERDAEGIYMATVSLASGTWDAVVSAVGTVLGPFELHERIRIEDAP